MNEEKKKNLIFKLRKETGLGVMDCKRCLMDYNWDYNIAKANYKKYFGGVLTVLQKNEL